MILLYLVSSKQSSLPYTGLSLVSLQRWAEIACVEVRAERKPRQNRSILVLLLDYSWLGEARFTSVKVNILHVKTCPSCFLPPLWCRYDVEMSELKWSQTSFTCRWCGKSAATYYQICFFKSAHSRVVKFFQKWLEAKQAKILARQSRKLWAGVQGQDFSSLLAGATSHQKCQG